MPGIQVHSVERPVHGAFSCVILLHLNRNKLVYSGALVQRENDAAA
jgi:hypothetical protein